MASREPGGESPGGLGMTLLVAYAASMTLLAAWFGCKALVFQRLMSGVMGEGPWGLVPFHDAVARFGGSAQVLAGPAYTLAFQVGGVRPGNIVGAVVVILFGCLAVSAFRRSRGASVPQVPSTKD